MRSTLNRYQTAYSQLDAAAATAVYPALNRQSLARAFDGLVAQRVTLGQCDVSVNGTVATAQCAGEARWTPKFGGGSQSSARHWQFELRETGGDWIITRAEVSER